MKNRWPTFVIRTALALALLGSIALLVQSRTVGLPAFLDPPSDLDVFSDPSARAPEIMQDGLVVNRAEVCVKRGATSHQVGRLAASVGGRVIGYPLHDRCYLFDLPTKTKAEFLRVLLQLESRWIVEVAAPDVPPTLVAPNPEPP
jgi:hypothetical protein